MSKFAKLVAPARLEGKTAKFWLPESINDGESFLIVKSAHDAGPLFLNAWMKRLGSVNQRGKMTAEAIAQVVEAVRDLFPGAVVVGWGGIVVDATGEECPFSAADCADLLRQLPDYVLTDLKQYCDTPANFTGEPAIDVEAVAGNSLRASNGNGATNGTVSA